MTRNIVTGKGGDQVATNGRTYGRTYVTKEDPVFSAEKTPAGGFPRKRDAYAILKAMIDALDRKAIPSPDERLKSIVGAQIRALLKGGYDFELVRHIGVELALSWDNARGHQRLLGLRQRVLAESAERDDQAHEDRKAETITDPAVLAAMGRPLGHIPGIRRTPGVWSRRCVQQGCLRHSLYGEKTCSDHVSAFGVSS